MYLDRVKIFIKAGNGGNGKTSFHTEKYVEKADQMVEMEAMVAL